MSRSPCDLSLSSTRFPSRPRFGAGTSLLQETKDILDALPVGEELGERAGPAVGSKVPLACGCVEGAVEEYVFDGL